MSDFFDLTIYSPEEIIFNNQAVELNATNSIGEFGILPGHTFFSSNIISCNLTFKSKEGDLKEYEVGSGLVTVKSDKVIVVLESAKLK
jgi:F-type H+-transporting ATPase subunit epsilon